MNSFSELTDKKCSTLRKGDSGESVSNLQSLLNAQGAHLVVDGVFNSSTLTAVISFQQRHLLKPTGTVDSSSWEALYQVVNQNLS